MGYEEEDEAGPPYTTIGTDEAKALIDSGVRVIDVRRPDEWNRGHVAQAELVTMEGIFSFGKALNELHLPKDEHIIFMCAVGQRSAMAAEIALVAGYTNVSSLANGISGWINRQYPIER